ncbi:uncharacterized protein LOC110447519 isoform X3 [Mizuhopecten yessoensis]|uniref:uncharacterized protein LOC110447519 isoform X3 n=1 Tax=Mizuhopecten yessoensis TaxID=6573 RepID=UPI000B45C315|nr:uncharacterized protein LOC110447519 isoform X3 [Mizuhopecten yessoensis]
MAECAFHQEARRRQANLDRQQEARKRFIARQSQNMSGALDPNLSGGNDAIMFSGADNFDTKREKSCHDTNAVPKNLLHELSTKKLANTQEQKSDSQKKRKQRKLDIERDQVYKILHPYEF